MRKRVFSKSRAGRQSGVTLIELLIAIVILLVGMLAALEFMTISIASNLNGQRLVVAKTLASDTMEQIFTMRDLNAIGGLPPADNRDQSTFSKLQNSGVGIFNPNWQAIQSNLGVDGIRGTTDDSGGPDPSYVEYEMRVLVRSADAECPESVDPATCGEPLPDANVKRLIIEVRYSLLRNNRLAGGGQRKQVARLSSFIAQPPSQVRVG